MARLGGLARAALVAFLVLAPAAPARAQWTRIDALPADEVSAVWADDDLILAGSGAAVYASADGGTSWTRSVLPGEGVDGIWAFARAPGRLYVGTLSHGVFVSADEGASWTNRSEGLEGAAARAITELAGRGDALYAGTSGAGVFVLDLADPAARWTPFREGLGDRVAWDVTALVAAETRLLAGAGANGHVFLRDPQDRAWTGVPFIAFDASGPMMLDVVAAAGRFVGGSTHGLFHSVDGGATWMRRDVGLGYVQQAALAEADGAVYAVMSRGALNAIWTSGDAGDTWAELERGPGPLAYDIAVHDGRLFVARLDGLWARARTGTSDEPPPVPSSLRLAPWPNLASGPVRIRFDLGAPADVSLTVHDVAGRRVAVLDGGPRSAGTHETAWDPAGRAAGVYFVRLTAGADTRVQPIVVVR